MQNADQEDAAQLAALAAWRHEGDDDGPGYLSAIASSKAKEIDRCEKGYKRRRVQLYDDPVALGPGHNTEAATVSRNLLEDRNADVFQAVHTLMLCDSLMDLIDEMPLCDATIIREAIANGRVDSWRRVQLCHARKRLWNLAKERGIL